MSESYANDPTLDLAFKTQGMRPLHWGTVRHILRGTPVPLTYIDEKGRDLYFAELWTTDDIKVTNIADYLRTKAEEFETEAFRVKDSESQDDPHLQARLRQLGDRAMAAADWFNEAVLSGKRIHVGYVPVEMVQWGAYHE